MINPLFLICKPNQSSKYIFFGFKINKIRTISCLRLSKHIIVSILISLFKLPNKYWVELVLIITVQFTVVYVFWKRINIRRLTPC